MSSPTSPNPMMARRILAAMLGVLLAGGLVARVVFSRGTPPPDPRDVEMLERQAGVVAALATAQPEPDHRLVLAIGSSLVEDGFAPIDFDARSAERGVATTSFNFGVIGVTPNLLRVIAHRAAKDFTARGRKADAIYLELTPHVATRRAIEHISGNVNGSRIVPVLDGEEAWRLARRAPGAAVQDFGSWLFEWHQSDELMGQLSERLLGPSPPPPTDSEIAKQLDEINATPTGKAMRARRRNEPPWNAAARGERARLSSPAEVETSARVTALMRVHGDARMYRNLVKSFDFLDLDFDPTLIDDFIGAFDELSKISSHVYVLVLPRRPKYPPSALGASRLEALLQRFRDRGMPVVSYFDSPELSDDDFRDIVHLSASSGRKKISERLANQLANER